MNLGILPLPDVAAMARVFDLAADENRGARPGLAGWYANIAGHLDAEARRRAGGFGGEPVRLPLTLDGLSDEERRELEAGARKSAIKARAGGAAEAAAFYVEIAMFLAGIMGPEQESTPLTSGASAPAAATELEATEAPMTEAPATPAPADVPAAPERSRPPELHEFEVGPDGHVSRPPGFPPPQRTKKPRRPGDAAPPATGDRPAS